MGMFLDKSGLSYLWSKIKGKLELKVDKVDGMGLSTNDFTNDLKTKLEGLENTTVDAALSADSENPVQNKVINEALNSKVSTSRTINGQALTANITLAAADVGAVASSSVGVANGVASLDANGTVPSSQLPSYVDDIVEGTLATFAATGEAGKIYVDTDTNKTYRWSGSAYVEISSSLAIGTTSSTAFAGDLGQVAYEHSQADHAPANAEANVQSDWNVTDTGSDAYIMNKPTSLPANGGNANTVNGLTVETAVPANAVFTDTTYDAITTAEIDDILAE